MNSIEFKIPFALLFARSKRKWSETFLLGKIKIHNLNITSPLTIGPNGSYKILFYSQVAFDWVEKHFTFHYNKFSYLPLITVNIQHWLKDCKILQYNASENNATTGTESKMSQIVLTIKWSGAFLHSIWWKNGEDFLLFTYLYILW